MYFLIAKRIDKYWSLYGTYSNKIKAEVAKDNFKQSMHLLGLMECRVIHESQVINIEKIGWENNIHFRII